MEILKVEVKGLDEVLADIDRRLAAAKQVVADDLTWAGQGAKAEMIATHTFQNRTYRLEGSIDFTVEHEEDFEQLVVFALTAYASMVEFGVPGHSRPYPFFWPVFYKWQAQLEEKLKEDWPHAFEQP